MALKEYGGGGGGAGCPGMAGGRVCNARVAAHQPCVHGIVGGQDCVMERDCGSSDGHGLRNTCRRGCSLACRQSG